MRLCGGEETHRRMRQEQHVILSAICFSFRWQCSGRLNIVILPPSLVGDQSPVQYTTPLPFSGPSVFCYPGKLVVERRSPHMNCISSPFLHAASVLILQSVVSRYWSNHFPGTEESSQNTNRTNYFRCILMGVDTLNFVPGDWP